jgi:hypothetical protein
VTARDIGSVKIMEVLRTRTYTFFSFTAETRIQDYRNGY